VTVTLDTNVWIAAFISRGYCAELVEYLGRVHSIVVSEFIIGEIRDKLTGKFLFSVESTEKAIKLTLSVSEVVEIEPLDVRVSRDHSDDNILATAMAGECECIITGDRDLLDLVSYNEIKIMRPSEFWAFEAKKGES